MTMSHHLQAWLGKLPWTPSRNRSDRRYDRLTKPPGD